MEGASRGAIMPWVRLLQRCAMGVTVAPKVRFASLVLGTQVTQLILLAVFLAFGINKVTVEDESY